MTAPFSLKDAAEIAYAGLPGVRVVANDGGTAVLFDETTAEGHAARVAAVRRLGRTEAESAVASRAHAGIRADAEVVAQAFRAGGDAAVAAALNAMFRVR